jgi:hypothetical protein
MSDLVSANGVHMIPLPERPFFIVGNARSGTTLLRFMLSSHPRIYVPPETGFLPFLNAQTLADLTLAEVEGLLSRIGRLNPKWKDTVPDSYAFYRSLPEPSLQHVLDSLFRIQIAGRQAARWGTQDPPYVRYIGEIDRIFPASQFVHLVRDGRDTTLSALKRWAGLRRPFLDSYYLLLNWSRQVEMGRAAASWLGPDRYAELRYEDLVQAPQRELERLCAFLGEDFNPSMLDHTVAARQEIQPGGPISLLEPVFGSSSQRWKDEMSVFQRKLADHLAGPTLVSSGYELGCAGPFSPVERARLYGLAAKYRVSDVARRLLYRLGVLKLRRGLGPGRP